MPDITSKAQLRYLWATHPDIAKRKADSMKKRGKTLTNLPDHVAGKKTDGRIPANTRRGMDLSKGNNPPGLEPRPSAAKIKAAISKVKSSSRLSPSMKKALIAKIMQGNKMSGGK